MIAPKDANFSDPTDTPTADLAGHKRASPADEENQEDRYAGDSTTRKRRETSQELNVESARSEAEPAADSPTVNVTSQKRDAPVDKEDQDHAPREKANMATKEPDWTLIFGATDDLYGGYWRVVHIDHFEEHWDSWHTDGFWYESNELEVDIVHEALEEDDDTDSTSSYDPEDEQLYRAPTPGVVERSGDLVYITIGDTVYVERWEWSDDEDEDEQWHDAVEDILSDDHAEADSESSDEEEWHDALEDILSDDCGGYGSEEEEK